MASTQASLKEEQEQKLRLGRPLGGLWTPPTTEETHLLAASNLWSEAQRRSVSEELKVKYGGGVARSRPDKGEIWVDKSSRVLVGWHGTTQPPSDMGSESMVEND
jgi:hypothetical protein